MAADLSFAVEAFDKAYGDSVALQRLHWDEICARKDAMRIDPDLERYRAAELSGRLVVVTARDAGTLVGYVVYFVDRHLHYRGLIMACQDLTYLHPAYRKGKTAMRMIDAAERAALDVARKRDAGARMLFTGRCKAAHDHSAIYLRRGYAVQDITLTKLV